MFPFAEELAARLPSTFHDQTYLNAARAHFAIEPLFLERGFNFLRLERAPALHQIVVGHFRWIDSKPEEMLDAYFKQWCAKARPSELIERKAASVLVDAPYECRLGDDAPKAVAFNADKSMTVDQTPSRWFWEVSREGNSQVLWINEEEERLPTQIGLYSETGLKRAR